MDLFDSQEVEFNWDQPWSARPASPPVLPDLPYPSHDSVNLQERNEEIERTPISSSSPQDTPEDLPQHNGENLDKLGRTVSGQVQAKCLLLTWSQAPQLSRELIHAHLETMGDLESLIVGQELHQDGGTHYHACAIFRTKIKKSPKSFAILGSHPNVRTANRKIGTLAQSQMNMWNYVQKEDQHPLIVGAPPTLKRSRNEVYLEATEIAVATSVDEALDYVRLNAPADYVQKLDSISRNLVSHRNKKTRHLVPARHLSEFINAPEIREDWRILFLHGKTGMGKTQWAKALLPEASIIRHRNQLADCDFSKGVIFDDFDVSHWPPTAVIHLCDWDEITGTDIKHGYVVIPPKTRKIFTFNKSLRAWTPPTSSDEQVFAIERRVTEIEINECLY